MNENYFTILGIIFENKIDTDYKIKRVNDDVGQVMIYICKRT